MEPTSLTIHSTANLLSTADNERDNLARVDNTRHASFHLVVDDKEAIECIPLNEVAWANGDGYYGEGNRSSISMEICESGNRAKTLDNAAKLAAKVLKENNIPFNKMVRHYDWTGKNCPRILSADNWVQWFFFKAEVMKYIIDNQALE